MTRVCFTGAGKSGDINVTRDKWFEMAEYMGWTPEKSLTKDTEILVASTTDTVKARTARSRGIGVWDYSDFLSEYQRIAGSPSTNDYHSQRQREQEEAAARVEEKRRLAQDKKDRETAELEAMVGSNPLWGSF